MSFFAYKAIHLAGVLTLVVTLAGVSVDSIRGGALAGSRFAALVRAVFGAAMFTALLGGFGMLARMGVLGDGLPGWASLKLGIWVAAGVAGFVAYRRPSAARVILIAVPIVSAIAGATAIFKPF